MSQELLYTSAPRGLKPGSRGFCTVLNTQGMAAALTTALEGLSGYRPVYPSGDDRANRNPVVYSHLKLQVSGRSTNVLSRIADFGLDYSQRANKLAHHVVLDQTELLPSGPANLLAMRDFMRESWAGEPTVIALKPVKRETPAPTGICRAWQEMTGDAGWAGVLAESFLQAPERLVVLLFAPGQDILPLFNEALSLLPVERRWDVTFSTYFTGLATGTTCTWRAMIHDSKEAHESLRFVNALRLDLTSDALGRATGGPLVDAARSGTRPHDARPRHVSRVGPTDEVFAEAKPVQVEFASDEPSSSTFPTAGASTPPRPMPPSLSPPPPQPVTGYGLQRPAPSLTPQPRPTRRLADVIEAETHRPPSYQGLWLTVGCVTLALVAFIVVKLGTPDKPRAGDDDPKAITTKPDQHGSTPAVAGANGNTGKATPPPVTPSPKPNTPTAPSVIAATTKTPLVSTPVEAPNNPSVATPDSTNTTANTAKPTPPKPIPREWISLPNPEKKTVELHSFDDVPVPAQPGKYLPRPTMVLLKPNWLPYVDKKPSDSHKKSEKAERAVMMPVATGDEAIALFTVTDISPPQVKYWLKSLNDEHVRSLGWYRIRILSAKAGEPALKDLAFAEFPLTIESSERHLKKSQLRWKLPTSALVNEQHRPQLVLDRLTIAVGNKDYVLDVGKSEPKSQWTCSCESIAAQAIESLDVKIKSDASKLNITIDVLATTDGPAIEVSLKGKSPFVSAIREKLLDRLSDEKTHVVDFIEKIDDKPKRGFKGLFLSNEDKSAQKLDDLLEQCSLANPLAAAKADEIKLIIQDAAKRADREIADEKTGKKRLEELKAIADKLPALIKLYGSVERYHPIVDSLDNVQVVAARLYYELTGRMKDAAGESVTITEVVDVVNFDDTQSVDAKPSKNRNNKKRADKSKGAKQ